MPPPAIKFDQFRQIVDEAYVKQDLLRFINTYLQDLIIEHKKLCKDYNVPVSDTLLLNNPKKQVLAEMFAPFLYYEPLFRLMQKALPDPLPTLINKVTWEGSQNQELLEKEFGINIISPDTLSKGYMSRYSEEVETMYLLFSDKSVYRGNVFQRAGQVRTQSQYIHNFYFREEIKQHLKGFLATPADFELKALNKIKSTGLTISHENVVFSDMPVMKMYVQQDNLKLSQSDKPLASSINKMRKLCDPYEFYPDDQDKDVANMRTQLISTTLLTVSASQLQESDTVGLVRESLKMFRKGRISIKDILIHIKGMGYLYQENTKVQENIVALLRQLPVEKWVSANNLLKYAMYRDIDLKPFSYSMANQYLYFNVDAHYGYKEKYAITESFYAPVVIEATLKGSFFLFASLGLVQIAFKQPEHVVASHFNRSYLSPYDGLQYIKLTPLGAYLCGLTRTYEAPKTDQSDVLLDENNLFISYNGKDKAKQLVIDQIAKKVGETLYKSDEETLLKGCSDGHDIKTKIDSFKEIISAEPPHVWNTFFDALLNKAQQIKAIQEYRLFPLPNHPELLRLIARDGNLKKYIIKAEKHHIAIEKRNIIKVKNYLKQFGFLIDFTNYN